MQRNRKKRNKNKKNKSCNMQYYKREKLEREN